MAALYQSLNAGSTPKEISDAYAEYVSGAGGNTSANQQAATTYLTNLGVSAPAIQSAYQNYLGGSTGALTQANTTTTQPSGALTQATTTQSVDPIEALYQQYAGRASDPSGLAYWKQQFGDTVDPNEVGIFQRAVADNVAKGVESTATGLNYNPYFTANPDVAAAYLKNSNGMTPDQFAAYHYQNYGVNEGRAAPAGATAPAATTTTPTNFSSAAQNYFDANPDVKAEYDMFHARDPNKWTPENYATYHYQNYGVNEGRAGSENISAITKNLADQILASSDPSTWTGEGAGSNQANAAGMASYLTSVGITNLDQLGVQYKMGPTETRYLYEGQPAAKNPDGSFTANPIIGYDYDGYPISAPKVVSADKITTQYGTSVDTGEGTFSFSPFDNSKLYRDKNGNIVYNTGQVEYINKDTGQAINPNYDRANPNAGIFGGTFAGKGSTSYKVTFDEQGKPHLSTEYGGTTGTWSNDIAPILPMVAAIALAAYTGGASLEALGAAEGAGAAGVAEGAGAAAGAAGAAGAEGLTAAQLAAAADAGLTGVGSNLASQSLAMQLGTSLGLEGTAANVAGNAIINGGLSAAQGKDPVKGALTGALTGGLGNEVGSYLSEATGLNSVLPMGTAANTALGNFAVNAATNGGDLGKAALSAGANYFGNQAGSAVNSSVDNALNAVSGSGSFGDVAGNIAGGATNAFISSQGKTNILSSLVMGGANAGTNALTNEIPGFSDLPVAVQNAAKAAISAELTGKDPTAAAVNAAINAGVNAIKSNSGTTGGITNRVYDDAMVQSGADAYIKAKSAGASDADALAAANAATGVVIPGADNLSSTLNTAKSTPGTQVAAVNTGAVSDAGTGGENESKPSAYDQMHTEISGVVPRDVLVAGGDGSLPDSFRPVAANQIQVDTNGLPKTIGIMDFNTGKVVPVPIQKDANGSFYYNTPEGTSVGVDASAFERAFYKSNPSEYLRIVNEIYANSGDIEEINRKLSQRGLSPEMAEQVHTIDVQAKDITGQEKATSETGKSGVGDFLSKLNLKGLLSGDVAEIAGAGEAIKNLKDLPNLPEVAKSLLNAQDFGYLNDIHDYLNNSTSLDDRQYYKGLAQELVKQNPGLADDPRMQDILSSPDVAMNLGDLGTVFITAPKIPKIDTTYDPNQPVFNPKDEETWPMAEDFNIDNPDTWPKVNVPPETTTKDNVATTTWVDDKTGLESSITVDVLAGTTTKITTDPKTKEKIVTVTDNKTGEPVKPDDKTATSTTTKTGTDLVNPPVVTPPVVNPPVVNPPVVAPPPVEPPVVTPPVVTEPPVVTPPVVTEPPVVTPPPVVTEPPVVTPPGTPVTPTTPVTPKVTTPTTPTVSLPSSSSGAGLGLMAGAALGGYDWNISPQSLKSRVTGGAIDPLAAVKQAQQEMETSAMMQNIDPRLAQILQDRMGGQSQGGVGQVAQEAAKTPENAYYSYGSEDSIDSVLGGQPANYKEGGYVSPLMMNSGGSMVLPLLAKSGGALSQHSGRENFKDGKHVAGEGDGQSDDIPAWLADGEFVVPSDVVSALGNGSTKAGTDKLYEMMHSIRDHARSTGAKDLPPPALKSPLDYLKSHKRSK